MAALMPHPTPDELREHARTLLPADIFDRIAGGADGEECVVANEAAFDRFYLRPRVLTGVSAVDTRTELLGSSLAAPILIAPMGVHKMVHPDGELATARAAARAGIGYIVSSVSSYSLEQIASAAPAQLWLQLYFLRDRGATRELVERARSSGYQAICLTVDVPVSALRRRDLVHDEARLSDGRSLDPLFENAVRASPGEIPQHHAGPLTWSDLEWLVSISDLPVLVKGVLTSEDARRAVTSGVDGVVVSNHGGRQLGRAPAALDVLEEITSEVGHDVPVLLDGGVRHASDVVVALALGARAVTVGRSVLWALACGGEGQASAYLEGLVRGLQRTLALMGRPSVESLDRSALSERSWTAGPEIGLRLT